MIPVFISIRDIREGTEVDIQASHIVSIQKNNGSLLDSTIYLTDGRKIIAEENADELQLKIADAQLRAERLAQKYRAGDFI